MQSPQGPFRAAEAIAAGALTRGRLRRVYVNVYPGVWVAREAQLTATQRARAAWLWSRRRGVLAGLSASALLGAKWIDGDTPAELNHPNRRAPPLLIVHEETLLPGEVQTRRGMAMTTPARTAFDLGRRLGLTEGVQRIDALMNATGLKALDVAAVAEAHRGARGLQQLGATLQLVDGGAESPYESLTRLLLVQAGFPPPQTQIRVYNDYGCVLACIDMGWEAYRVGVDFEGAHHWFNPVQRERDAERYYTLPELGWIDLRLTASRLHRSPGVFLDRVGAALIGRGCPKTW